MHSYIAKLYNPEKKHYCKMEFEAKSNKDAINKAKETFEYYKKEQKILKECRLEQIVKIIWRNSDKS